VALEIEYLAQHLDAIPTLARWHHAEWVAITPHLSIADRIAGFQARAQRGAIPTGFVALLDANVVGLACHVESDIESHQHLAPCSRACSWRQNIADKELAQLSPSGRPRKRESSDFRGCICSHSTSRISTLDSVGRPLRTRAMLVRRVRSWCGSLLPTRFAPDGRGCDHERPLVNAGR